MKLVLQALFVVASLVGWNALAAQGDENPQRAAAEVAPFVDEQTIAIARIDVSRIDVDALLDKWVELVPNAKRDANELRQPLKVAHAAFTKAQIGPLYVVFSLADLPQRGPLAIAPNADAAAAGIKPAMAGLSGFLGSVQVSAIRGALCMGDSAVLERLEVLKPHQRPELAQAFAAAGDHAVQLVFIPSDNERRVLEELMPQLPKFLGGGSSTLLTQGARWMAIGIDPPPSLRLELTVQSADSHAAEGFRDLWARAFDSLAKSMKSPLPAETLSALSPKVENDALLLTLDEADGSLESVLASIREPLAKLQQQTSRRQSMRNLMQLALGALNYESAKGRLVPSATYDSSGQPLLSWRVQILPYLEEGELYKQFHLDEPWDSPHNRTLIEKMPEIFRDPGSTHRAADGLATYREVVGEHTVFPGREGVKYKDIIDGTSNTIMFVEVDDDHAVVWTKPGGLPYDAENPSEALGGHYDGGFLSCFCDGHGRFIELPIDKETMRRLLLRDDKEVVKLPPAK